MHVVSGLLYRSLLYWIMSMCRFRTMVGTARSDMQEHYIVSSCSFWISLLPLNAYVASCASSNQIMSWLVTAPCHHARAHFGVLCPNAKCSCRCTELAVHSHRVLSRGKDSHVPIMGQNTWPILRLCCRSNTRYLDAQRWTLPPQGFVAR